jgi:protein CpxP
MKINKIGLITAVALGGLLACNVATAQEEKAKKGERRGMAVEQQLERITTELKLTDQQKPKIKAALEDTAKKRQELRDAAPEERREKMRALMEEQNKKFKEILTAEQYGKWEKVRDDFRGKKRPGGAGGDKKKEGAKQE